MATLRRTSAMRRRKSLTNPNSTSVSPSTSRKPAKFSGYMERETGWVDFQRLEARGWKRVKAPSELRDALRRSSGIDVREDELELGLRQRPRVSQRSGAGAGTGH